MWNFCKINGKENASTVAYTQKYCLFGEFATEQRWSKKSDHRHNICWFLHEWNFGKEETRHFLCANISLFNVKSHSMDLLLYHCMHSSGSIMLSSSLLLFSESLFVRDKYDRLILKPYGNSNVNQHFAINQMKIPEHHPKYITNCNCSIINGKERNSMQCIQRQRTREWEDLLESKVKVKMWYLR